MASLELRGVVKQYDTHQAVKGINLSIADNEFVVLVGPSGCGKSTTLRMIAGLEEISDGEIAIDNAVVNHLEPAERDIAMVFQNYALYPHMTVRDNIAFCLEQRKMPPHEIDERIRQAARTLHIAELLHRKPSQLSGGQRQRVAMGRAIVRHPKVFLFDEPLSNLDASLRVKMRTEIKRLHQLLPTTTVYVTHDQIEAMTMADRVVVMNGGNIEQMGPPEELYHFPASLFVAGFIGAPAMNLLPASLEARSDSVRLEDGLQLQLGRSAPARAPGEEAVIIGIRPECLSPSRQSATSVSLSVTVDLVESMGMESMIYFTIGKNTVSARIPGDARLV